MNVSDFANTTDFDLSNQFSEIEDGDTSIRSLCSFELYSESSTLAEANMTCRLCEQEMESSIYIFEVDNERSNLQDLIESHLHIDISPADNSSPFVCIKCFDILINFHELYVSCMQTKEYFEWKRPQHHRVIESTLLKKNDGLLVETPVMNKDFSLNPDPERQCRSQLSHYGSIANVSDLWNVSDDDSEDELISHCEFCSHECTSLDDLNEHLINFHSDKVVLCDICNLYIPRKLLTIHMERHSVKINAPKGNQEKSLECKKCKKVFSSRSGLHYHRKIVHEGSHKFRCHICNKDFGYKNVLENHLNAYHTRISKYFCEQCDKPFKTAPALYAHSITHKTLTLPFHQCSGCDKKFKFPDQLKKHQFTMHTENNKIWKCKSCTRSFTLKGNLKKHLETHAITADYRCQLCDFQGKQRRYLTGHMKRHHNR